MAVWQLQLREEARRKAEAGASASPTTAVRTEAHRSLARAEHWARRAAIEPAQPLRISHRIDAFAENS